VWSGSEWVNALIGGYGVGGFVPQRESSWEAVPATNSATARGIAAPTATGTATAASPATTNTFTRQRRVEALVTVAATNAVAGWRSSVESWSVGGSVAGQGGFRLLLRWGPATGVATAAATSRAFAGMTVATAAPTDVDPSTLVSMVGMGWDDTDANVQIMHNDAAGTATKVDLGASFPRPTVDRTTAYELELYSPPGTTQAVAWRVRDITTGVEATGDIITDLPAATGLMVPRCWMSVGGTSSVIGVALMRMLLLSDT
jgi:hypothetical protein